MNTIYGVRRFAVVLILLILGLSGLLPCLAAENAGDVRESFEPGVGAPIGTIDFCEGRNLIRHAGESVFYLARTGLPLFTDDTVTTESNGNVRIILNDESSITLFPETTIVFNRNLYDPESKSRSWFMRMGFGKARFMIKKLFGFERSEVKVKTKTAIIGVRGSDFIVDSTEELSEIVALENTELELVSVKDPETIIVLNDFERVRIDASGRISEIERLIREDIDRIRRELRIAQMTSGITRLSQPETIVMPRETLVNPGDVSGADTGSFQIPETVSGPESRFDFQDQAVRDATRIYREGTSDQPEIPDGLEPFQFPGKPDE